MGKAGIEKRSINALFVLRFLGAMVVVIHHYGRSTITPGTYWSEFFTYGAFILSFFFVLSGFLLGYNYFDPKKFNAKTFAVRRLARFAPIYLLALFATLFTAMYHHDAYPKGFSIIAQALAMHAWIPGSVLEINYPSWSISVEIFFCILFPFLVYRFGSKSLRSLAIWAAVIWIASSIQHLLLETYLSNPKQKWTGEFILYFPLWHLNAFTSGMLAGEILKRISFDWVPKWLPSIAGITCLVLVMYVSGVDNPIRQHIHNGLLSPILALMLLAFALDTTAFSKAMGATPLVYLGNLTYAIYIFQYPVHMWCEMLIYPEGIEGSNFYTYFAILIGFSAIVYSGIEKPSRVWIIRKLS